MSTPPLQKGDLVQIVAPSGKSATALEDLEKSAEFLKGWGLKVQWSAGIFGCDEHFPDLANTDQKRFLDLQQAILNPAVKAIWCFRGGYGGMRLIPYLRQINFIPPQKIFIGFSDSTLLHLYFQRKWQWKTLHASHIAAIAKGKTTQKDNELLRQLLLGEIEQTTLSNLEPLNLIAQQTFTLQSNVVGGNLTLVTRTLGSDFAIQLQGKILLLEEIDEPFRKIDGMLRQLIETGMKPQAVIFGNMTIKNQGQKKMIRYALQEFANFMNQYQIPVLFSKKIGHGKLNQPIPFGTFARLSLGRKPALIIDNIN